MTITLQPHTEARLREKADREKEDLNALVDKLLTIALEWEAQDHAEAVEGIRRGLEDFEQGRYRPFREFAAEQRTKHHLPSADTESK